MLILVIDTAGSVGGVMLARNEGHAFDRAETEILGEGRLGPREFSTQLIPTITALLRASQLALSDVDVFAVVSGPGSFTGLRVGLSAVKALSEVTAKPIVALSRLAIMVSAANVFSLPEHAGEAVHAVLDAGRGEFYHGIYRDGGRTCIAESLQTYTTLSANLKGVPGLIVASEAIVLDAVGTSLGMIPIPAVTVLEAFPLVLSALQDRRFSDVAMLDANYLRRLDVENTSRTQPAAKPANVPVSGL